VEDDGGGGSQPCSWISCLPIQAKVWALLKQQTYTTVLDCLILQILNWPNMDSSSDIAELRWKVMDEKGPEDLAHKHICLEIRHHWEERDSMSTKNGVRVMSTAVGIYSVDNSPKHEFGGSTCTAPSKVLRHQIQHSQIPNLVPAVTFVIVQPVVIVLYLGWDEGMPDMASLLKPGEVKQLEVAWTHGVCFTDQSFLILRWYHRK
jgi:hypothetical protein